jgi:hypothetical protein
MTHAQAPKQRPTWMTVMASAMLLYGGLTLVGALFTLRDPKAVAVMAIEDLARSSAQPEIAQRLDAVNEAILAQHRRAIRAGALISIGVGLLTLYAVAAILSRDRNGRLLALCTGWVGIAYQLGSLPFGVTMARQAAREGAPLLARVLVESGKQAPGTTAEQLAGKLHTAIVAPPVVAALLGAGWCLMMLVYFGGSRGRAVYGLDGGLDGPGAGGLDAPPRGGA